MEGVAATGTDSDQKLTVKGNVCLAQKVEFCCKNILFVIECHHICRQVTIHHFVH